VPGRTGPAGASGAGGCEADSLRSISTLLTATADDGIFGCTGGIWLPKKQRFERIDINVDLPQKITDAAEAKTQRPRYAFHDETDADRLLMGVVCTLPDVQDPKVQKAYEHVGKMLGKDVRKLQKEMEKTAGAEGVAMSRDGSPTLT
jgi:hypothetical protein